MSKSLFAVFFLVRLTLAMEVTPTRMFKFGSTDKHRAIKVLGNRLWVGYSTGEGNLKSGDPEIKGQRHFVTSFDLKTLSRLETIELPHTPELLETESNRLFVFGKRWDEERNMVSALSEVTVDSQALTATPVFLGDSFYAESIAIFGNTFFLPDYLLGDVYAIGSGRSGYLGTRIQSPISVVVEGNSLFVTSSPLTQPAADSIIRVDLTSGGERVILPPGSIQGTISTLESIPGLHRIVATAPWADLVYVIDSDVGNIVEKVQVRGGPRGVAASGKCLFVMAEQTKEISVLDLSSKPVKIVDKVGFGKNLGSGQFWDLDFDSSTGRIFTRERYPPGTAGKRELYLYFLDTPNLRKTCGDRSS